MEHRSQIILNKLAAWEADNRSGRLFRILSTVLVAVGVSFIFYYIFRGRMGRGVEVFSQPGYYFRQNYVYLFGTGAVVTLSALIGSFFAWHRDAEFTEKALPNAGFSQGEEIHEWLQGSTLDTGQSVEFHKSEAGKGDTELLLEEERTEIIVDDKEGEG